MLSPCNNEKVHSGWVSSLRSGHSTEGMEPVHTVLYESREMSQAAVSAEWWHSNRIRKGGGHRGKLRGKNLQGPVIL